MIHTMKSLACLTLLSVLASAQRTGVQDTSRRLAQDDEVSAAEEKYITSDASIADTLATYPELSSFVAALTESGRLAQLSGAGGAPRTVFAPTNEAFLRLLSYAAADDLPSVLSSDSLARVLDYHVAEGAHGAYYGNLQHGSLLATTAGLAYSVAAMKSADAWMIYGAYSGALVSDTIITPSGPIYVISTVLLPSPVVPPQQEVPVYFFQGDLSIAEVVASTQYDSRLLADALSQTGMEEALGSGLYTLFLAKDGAFESFFQRYEQTREVLPDDLSQFGKWQDTLRLHVVEGLRSPYFMNLPHGATLCTLLARQDVQLSPGGCQDGLGKLWFDYSEEHGSEFGVLTSAAAGKALVGDAHGGVAVDSSLSVLCSNGIVHFIGEPLIPMQWLEMFEQSFLHPSPPPPTPAPTQQVLPVPEAAKSPPPALGFASVPPPPSLPPTEASTVSPSIQSSGTVLRPYSILVIWALGILASGSRF